MKESKAILLINLGSPDSCSVADVRKYLLEFLMDDRVIDLPFWRRYILVKGIIVPFRARRSAKAYRKIWTAEGSPLITISEKLKQLVQDVLDIPVVLGMRYGNPSINHALQLLKKEGVNNIKVFLLYPHYAMSSYETAMVKVEREKARVMPDANIDFHPPFYRDKDYIDILCNIIRENFEESAWDHIIFSYHGIPERHLGPNHKITIEPYPCSGCRGEVADKCYRRHCIEMTMDIVNKMKLEEANYSISFQSRLGNSPWLRPYTTDEVKRVASMGKKNLLMVTPSFVADCLETLEEIGMEAKEDFMAEGGSIFKVASCPNYRSDWVGLIKKWSRSWINSK